MSRDMSMSAPNQQTCVEILDRESSIDGCYRRFLVEKIRKSFVKVLGFESGRRVELQKWDCRQHHVARSRDASPSIDEPTRHNGQNNRTSLLYTDAHLVLATQFSLISMALEAPTAASEVIDLEADYEDTPWASRSNSAKCPAKDPFPSAPRVMMIQT